MVSEQFKNRHMITDKEKKLLARYEQQLAFPKWKYIIIYGVLAWGLTTGILVSLINLLVWGKSFNELIRQELWITLVVFMIAGILFGYLVRKSLPRQIKKLKDKESHS